MPVPQRHVSVARNWWNSYQSRMTVMRNEPWTEFLFAFVAIAVVVVVVVFGEPQFVDVVVLGRRRMVILGCC